MSRNLVSQYLNEAHGEGTVIKINTRPVYFLNKAALCERTKAEDLESTYDSVEELMREAAARKEKIVSFRKLVGHQESLKQCVEQCKAAITYPGIGLPILLQGQTGTGKSYIAQLTYEYSVEKGILDKKGSFVTVNCAEYANNPELFLTNLFGYKKGSYTGAEKDKAGLLALADGGVLFLDEIHALKPECQEKIFLFMDKGIYHMVGDNETWYSAKVRLIFATTEDPQKVLLKTLLRRIPILVQVPSLVDRSLQEKRELVHEIVPRKAGRSPGRSCSANWPTRRWSIMPTPATSENWATRSAPALRKLICAIRPPIRLSCICTICPASCFRAEPPTAS